MDTTTTEWTPKAGCRAWCRTFECNVDVIRTYRDTVTVRYWGRGLLDGRLVTARGIRRDSLSAPRSPKFGSDGKIVRDEYGCIVFV